MLVLAVTAVLVCPFVSTQESISHLAENQVYYPSSSTTSENVANNLLLNGVSAEFKASADSHGIIQPGKHAVVELPDGTKVNLSDHGRFEWWDHKNKSGKVEVQFKEEKVNFTGLIQSILPWLSTYSLLFVDTMGHIPGFNASSPIDGTFSGWFYYDGSDWAYDEYIEGYGDKPFLIYEGSPVSLGNFSIVPAEPPQGYPEPYIEVDWRNFSVHVFSYEYLMSENLWVADDVTGEKEPFLMDVEMWGTFSMPFFHIENISGGFGVTTTIINVGNRDAENVNWSITVDGRWIFLGKVTKGVLTMFPVGEEKTMKSNLIFGIGRATIIVNVEGMVARRECFVLGPFVLGVK